MAVYVDPLFNYGGGPSFRWTHSCHMYADTLEELHAMAKAVGMKREWFQDKPGFPHYDLVATRRSKAIKLGAIEQSRRHLFEWLKANR